MAVGQLDISVPGQGLHEFTDMVEHWLQGQIFSGDGLCTLFIQHTSASLLIQENADPSARVDLENWLNRLVPENDSLYTHTMEGADDMPAHIKSALTASSLSIPVHGGKLMLGTWQGIFLWEHRHHRGKRRVLVHVSS
ncbi:secondary thiamine-phosphate synthase enzyme YjbQ [Microbulbifer pacificus]|uniref:secondary thiamine-phosphate synthase enzyme YjbQ n=1 Tax=Microbulbifer pacificus TaxID=407164 RepID=UPI000CF57C2B|nr:secondary thiamine-phosphate synthase enzyme YjbQ [Microbulbifer pacificus]